MMVMVALWRMQSSVVQLSSSMVPRGAELQGLKQGPVRVHIPP